MSDEKRKARSKVVKMLLPGIHKTAVYLMDAYWTPEKTGIFVSD